jgi:hypothetical protein
MSVLGRAVEIHATHAVTRAQALVLAASELAGRPLDVRDLDAAAVCLRAASLFMSGRGLREALLAARCERGRNARERLGIRADMVIGTIAVLERGVRSDAVRLTQVAVGAADQGHTCRGSRSQVKASRARREAQGTFDEVPAVLPSSDGQHDPGAKHDA